MASLYKVLVISNRNTILNNYEVNCLTLLIDDLKCIYPYLTDKDIQSLIETKSYVTSFGMKFLYYEFKW